MVIAENYGDKL